MKHRLAPLVCTLAALAVGCGGDGNADGTTSGSTGPATTSGPSSETDDPTGDPPPGSTGPDEGTTSGTTAADETGSTGSTGEPGDLDVELQFAVRVGADDAACGQSYENVGAAGTTIEFLDIRFFVSNIRLVDDTGAEVPLSIEDDGEWQVGGSVMLDFEDGSGGCTENTTAATNTVVVGTAPDATYTGVRFDLGLPFEQNHLNADEAPPPLNTTAMFWNWAAGYKFAKIDIANDNPAPGNRWNFHLGSQACDNGDAGPTVPPTEECGRPGRPAIALDGFDPLSGTIVLDMAAVYTGVDVAADTEMTAPGCMSFMPDINECEDLYPNLGLSWATGDCENDCADQIAFSGE